MSRHRVDTWLLEIPVIPRAWTSSSTLRVDIPPIQDSWIITAVSACSVSWRGSRKLGKYVPWRSLGTRRSSVPKRVCSVRSR